MADYFTMAGRWRNGEWRMSRVPGGANGRPGAHPVRSPPVQALLGGLLEERGVLSSEIFLLPVFFTVWEGFRFFWRVFMFVFTLCTCFFFFLLHVLHFLLTLFYSLFSCLSHLVYFCSFFSPGFSYFALLLYMYTASELHVKSLKP